jgi:hypothetical protein
LPFEALQQKLDDPSISLFISIEPNSHQFDELWSNPLVLSAMDSSFTIVRLSQESDAEEIAQISEIYNVHSLPALVYFAPGRDEVTRTWSGRLPGPDELFGFLVAKLEAPRRTSGRAARAGQSAKVSLRYGDIRFTNEFALNATIGELRSWAVSQCGADVTITLGHTGEPIPGDDALTVTQAGLVPSAALTAVPNAPDEGSRMLQAEEPLPDLPVRVETADVQPEQTPAERGARTPKFWSWKGICQFFNPWPGINEVEDLFVTKE